MEANAWWLLAIPLFFGLGWLASRLDSAQLFTQTRQLPESYFKGLNFLLNEQYEQAIASFEEVARLDPATAELYFALGNLFRKRGETERAIRIHRNLLERADLPETQRQQALFCLAQDYLNAGIFDRAESAFSALAHSDYAPLAQRELAKLYEKESNWDAAIACLQRYLASAAPQHASTIEAQEDLSHYACELASVHLEHKDYSAASAAVALAEHAHPKNPRSYFVKAALLLSQGYTSPALELIEPLLLTQPALNTLAIHTFISAAVNPEVLAALKRWAAAAPSADSIKPLLPLLQEQGDTPSMIALLSALANPSNPSNPSKQHTPQRLATASVLLASAQQADFLTQASEWQAQAIHTVDALSSRYDRPTCTHCGFKASRHQWRCPGCARWNTLPYSGTA